MKADKIKNQRMLEYFYIVIQIMKSSRISSISWFEYCLPVGAWALFELRKALFYFPTIIEPIICKIVGSNTVFPGHHYKTRTSSKALYYRLFRSAKVPKMGIIA